MPLTTIIHNCGCRQRFQGYECECMLDQLCRINDPAQFYQPYLPFNMASSTRDAYSSCRQHDRYYRSKYDCRLHLFLGNGASSAAGPAYGQHNNGGGDYSSRQYRRRY